MIDFYTTTYEKCMLMGDFNLKPCDKSIQNFMDKQDLFNSMKEKTCFKSLKGTCIDLIMSNQRRLLQHTHAIETGLSDFHLLAYTMLKTTFTKFPPKKISYRCYKKFNEDLFLSDLKSSLLNINNYTSFQKQFLHILQVHAPLKEKSIRGNNKPHVTKTLRKAIMLRSRLKNKANKSKLPDDILLFKKQRNLVVSLNRKEKKSHFSNIQPTGTTCKDFWNFCKPYFSDKAGKPEERILLVNDKKLVTNNRDVANAFNTFFTNITSTLNIYHWKNSFNFPLSDPILRAIGKFSTHPSILNIQKIVDGATHEFSFRHVSPDVIFKCIKGMDVTKSNSGNIPTKILKLANTVIFKSLTDCINESITKCCFPGELKAADVSPIYKDGDHLSKENYRPISILSNISKVFERILFDQITGFTEKFLSPKLCGFRKGYSTQHALFNLLQNWQKCLDKSGVVGTLLMDLSKAYDCLPHDLLIAKLAAYGLNMDSLRLLYSYLSKRYQRVKIGSSFSDLLEVILGLPQGSILGPILFNIFINDLIFTVQETEICNFADDTTLYACDNSIEIVLYKLMKDTYRVTDWFKVNSMVANPAKFQLMILGTDSMRIKEGIYIDVCNLCMRVNNMSVRNKMEVKLLGVTIDRKLNFVSHIENICSKANKRVKALQRIRRYINLEQAKFLADAFIMSAFRYCVLIWMFCDKTSNTLIDKVHQRTLRTVHMLFNHDLLDLLSIQNTVTVHVKNVQVLMCEVYKSLHHNNPSFMWSLFTEKTIPYQLRNSNLLCLPVTKTLRYGLNSLIFRATLLWNTLPPHCKKSESIKKFKRTIMTWRAETCTCKICRV